MRPLVSPCFFVFFSGSFDFSSPPLICLLSDLFPLYKTLSIYVPLSVLKFYLSHQHSPSIQLLKLSKGQKFIVLSGYTNSGFERVERIRKAKTMEIRHSKHESWSDTESTSSNRVGYSGPLSGPILMNNKKSSSKKSARFKDGDDEYVEITLDIREDSVSVQNIKGGDPETAMLATRLEKRPSFGSQLSFRIRQVSQELKRMTSTKAAAPFNKVDRSKSGAARALQGLKFMTTKNVGSEGWSEVEKRFDELSVDGSLLKSLFGQCLGNATPSSPC
ncbi:NADPH oxidase Respiratory burst - like 1 [Theobroma cacao]|nr:NADPH oxidase Respiratory burst - like 1 [Theobroma cacao]